MRNWKEIKESCILANFKPKNATFVTTYDSPKFREPVKVYFWMKHFIHTCDCEVWITAEARGLQW